MITEALPPVGTVIYLQSDWDISNYTALPPDNYDYLYFRYEIYTKTDNYVVDCLSIETYPKLAAKIKNIKFGPGGKLLQVSKGTALKITSIMINNDWDLDKSIEVMTTIQIELPEFRHSNFRSINKLTLSINAGALKTMHWSISRKVSTSKTISPSKVPTEMARFIGD